MKTMLKRYLEEENGAAAVEAALLAPIFIPLLIGTFELLFITYTSSALDRAVNQTVMEIRLGQSAGIAKDGGIPPDLYYKQSICDKLAYLNCRNNINVDVTTYTENLGTNAMFDDRFVDPGTLGKVNVSLDLDVIGFMAALTGEPFIARTAMLFHTEPY
jgi:Flp pilus assembly protein TadG